jgi:hypothetical protein
MAIFSKSTESAQNTVTKAESVVAEWDSKAAAARAEVARLNAESGAAILADESAADQIALNVQSWELKAKAYDQAAKEAAQKLLRARREVLEAEARHEEKEAAVLQKQSEAHAAKVAVLQKQLEELDECDWIRGQTIDTVNGNPVGWQLGRGSVLASEAERHAVRAAGIRYFIATGKVPNDYYELNDVVGTSFNGFARSIHERDNIPKSLYAARDAGLNFAGAAA